jgi:hypothetical protein
VLTIRYLHFTLFSEYRDKIKPKFSVFLGNTSPVPVEPVFLKY